MTTAPKIRSRPHVWATFWSLNVGENFYLGQKLFTKTGVISARPAPGGVTFTPLRFLAPWRRVRTTKLVAQLSPALAKALTSSSPFVACLSGAPFQSGLGDYVRGSIATPTGSEDHLSTEAEALIPDERPRISQPASDNGVCGPTS